MGILQTANFTFSFQDNLQKIKLLFHCKYEVAA